MKKRFTAILAALAIILKFIPTGTLATDNVPVNEIFVEYNAEDATENIKTALLRAKETPGRDRVILSNQGGKTVWISGPITLGNNVELFLEKDVTLQAKSGEFEYYKQSFISIEDKKDVAIKGADKESSKISMLIEEYFDGEWRHCINIAGGTNVVVENLTCEKGGGDGINISDLYLIENVISGANENILIENVICDGNARNGISIISGNNIIVNSCTLSNTGQFNPSGLASSGPWAGIDIEPERRKNVTNVSITNCKFNRNRNIGLCIAYAKLVDREEGAVLNVNNCTFSQNQFGIRATGRNEVLKGVINIENCLIQNSTYYSIYFREWKNDKMPINFKDCLIVNGDSQTDMGTIHFENNITTAQYKTGNVNFENVYSFLNKADNVLSIQGGTPENLISGIKGNIYIDSNINGLLTKTENYENVDVKFSRTTKTKEEILETLNEQRVKYNADTKALIEETEKKMEISAASQGNTADDVIVKIDNSPITFSDQSPLIIDGRTLVPMRTIFETMGAEVLWDGDTRTVTATKDSTVISLTVDNSVAHKNDEQITLDVTPQIINSRTMVPLRFVGEALDADVKWEKDTRTVLITNPRKVTPQAINGNEIIVSCNTVGYEEFGAEWSTSGSALKNYDGTTVRTSTYYSVSEKFSPSVIYTPVIAQNGKYDVYVYRCQHSNADTAVGFEIVDKDGKVYSDELGTQDWSKGESEWLKVTEQSGPISFSVQDENGTQYVKVKRTKTKSGYTRGTAVKLVAAD